MSSHKLSRQPRSAQRQHGVSLVEVLVSVVVVALGLLGAVALQATALRNNQGAYERTQTSILTQGIFDAMRANLPGVASGSYNTDDWVCTAPNATTLASRDIARWVNNLHSQIHPGACGSIACTANACTVGVRWDDSRATQGSSAQQITLEAQL